MRRATPRWGWKGPGQAACQPAGRSRGAGCAPSPLLPFATAHPSPALSPTPCLQFGEEVKGSNTDPSADGKTPATAFVFAYPYTTAAKLWFKVTVVVGGTRSDASGIYGPVIMGEQQGPSCSGLDAINPCSGQACR